MADERLLAALAEEERAGAALLAVREERAWAEDAAREDGGEDGRAFARRLRREHGSARAHWQRARRATARAARLV